MDGPDQGTATQSSPPVQDECSVAVSQALLGTQVGSSNGARSLGCRFLFNNSDAGIIIGRGGSNRHDIQMASGARAQLSRPNEFWPGTTDRVLLLSGTLKAIVTALWHILTKIGQDVRSQQQQGSSTQPATAPELNVDEHAGNEAAGAAASITSQAAGQPSHPNSIKLLLPAAICGSVIGRRGETIKAFAADSGASISLSPQDRDRGLDYDRIVTVYGSMDRLLRAVALIMGKAMDAPPGPQPGVMLQGPPQPGMGLARSLPAAAYSPGMAQYAPSMGQYAGVGAVGQYAGGAVAAMPTYTAPAAAAYMSSTAQGVPQTVQPSNGSGFNAFNMRTLQQALQQQLQPTSQQTSLPGIGMLASGHSAPSMGVQAGGMQAPTAAGVQRVEMSMLVPQQHVGAIIGRGGSVLQSLKNLLSVSVVVADRTDADQLSGGRRVHIYGTPEAVQMAQQIISQKVQEAATTATPSGNAGAGRLWPM
uniref:K Homology domain-containing protein n=1 Tax=Chlamydomonas leiostraca TaxID=1034604 RepID=A0A7S0RKW4_9CHLO|mmetsp:Transcript_25217/g.64040  ORF Transcript_25217/g.64040 Transcript_25217/m.64040 type:complete len:477 (+) Transcript_25217:139-1569(+)|eukprot:CAMPEP_0202859268 /NCGR_PEP_ID=MMETSP1391-20130828/1460_1 /ASSEMBLY_ACC=CAM_ASM_000867 /TAXON_ID=1034604 /ORGANISM="Chlamydomonas leiostraca, Strain SAG 11-49" /LENGTH=476 /DNA_ID=CAMNT_0049538291 /DNA_START=88 /DNA_END=1521 /DNA_ORIENTATION=-